MRRRDFLKLLGVGSTVTAAGLLVPEAPRRIYSFLTNNPLAADALTASTVTATVEQWGASVEVGKWFQDAMLRETQKQYEAWKRMREVAFSAPGFAIQFARYPRAIGG